MHIKNKSVIDDNLRQLYLTLAAMAAESRPALESYRYYGLVNFNLGFLEKYTHALAGVIIALSRIAIKLLGI